MTTRTATPANRGSVPATWKQSGLRWLPTFFGFPLGGLIAERIAGPVDGLAPALIGGAVTGILIGAIQAWGLGSNGPSARRWTTATALGLTGGIAIGSAVVGYGTGIGELVTQGAICGLIVGAAQAIVLRPQLGRVAYLWAPALSALWALGWAITTGIGIDVDRQWTVFGSSGALVVTAATAVLPVLLAVRRFRSTS
ncbi:MAG: hypothetical protein QOJ97_1395 [Solirubrobacteraceae bacterium]|jgi:hypothetical protein|nr:hypothetical protein [Solirubrobacteraceae bacterium]